MEPLPLFHDICRLYNAHPHSKHLRLGQWFMIQYAPRMMVYPALFYCEDKTLTLQMIQEKFYT